MQIRLASERSWKKICVSIVIFHSPLKYIQSEQYISERKLGNPVEIVEQLVYRVMKIDSGK